MYGSHQEKRTDLLEKISIKEKEFGDCVTKYRPHLRIDPSQNLVYLERDPQEPFGDPGRVIFRSNPGKKKTQRQLFSYAWTTIFMEEFLYFLNSPENEWIHRQAGEILFRILFHLQESLYTEEGQQKLTELLQNSLDKALSQ